MSDKTEEILEIEKKEAYIKALKTNRCVDIMKAYHDWKGEPHHKPWKDDSCCNDEQTRTTKNGD